MLRLLKRYWVVVRRPSHYLSLGFLTIGGFVAGAFGVVVGQIVMIVASLILMLVIPASIMVLALTDDLAESINPEELWRMIAAIGLPYLGLWGCLSLLMSSGAAALAGCWGTSPCSVRRCATTAARLRPIPTSE